MCSWVLILWAYSGGWGWASAMTTIPGFATHDDCVHAAQQFLSVFREGTGSACCVSMKADAK